MPRPSTVSTSSASSEASRIAGGGRLLGQLDQGAGVVEGGPQRLELVEVGRDPPQLLGDGSGVVGVVPEVRASHRVLELGPAHLELLAPEVALGLGQPLPQRFELEL